MKKRTFNTDEELTLLEGEMYEIVELFRTFEPGEYFTMKYAVSDGFIRMQRYVDRLRRAGLDIGKGDAEFGYRMPLPGKKDVDRELTIFRRR
jgi:hypothetical protein